MDPFNNKISNESPIGIAVLGHKVGDVMELCMSDSISDKIIFGWYQMEIKQVDTEKKLYTFIDPFFKDRKIEFISLTSDNMFKSVMRQNSEIELAPARLTTRSAAL